MIHCKLNIPNFITFLRILSVPVLIFLAVKGDEKTFFYLFLFAAFTDALDGFIARVFNMKTATGAYLDSLADFLLFLSAIWGIYLLKLETFGPYKWLFFLMVFMLVFPDIYSLAKFGKISSLHLYSWKIGGILQFLFIFWLFYKGFDLLFFQIVLFWTFLAFAENMFIQIKYSKPLTDVKSVFLLSAGKERKDQ